MLPFAPEQNVWPWTVIEGQGNQFIARPCSGGIQKEKGENSSYFAAGHQISNGDFRGALSIIRSPTSTG